LPITKIQKSTQEIAKIIKAIDEIAFQTSFLALFAVVCSPKLVPSDMRVSTGLEPALS
jgi:hypothetical protein